MDYLVHLRVVLQPLEAELQKVVALFAVPAEEPVNGETPCGTHGQGRRVRFQHGFLDRIIQILLIDRGESGPVAVFV